MKHKLLLLFIIVLLISGCSDIYFNRELRGKELVESSCEDLYESMEKCDSTGLRTDTAREQCKTNHLIIIKVKCLE